MLAGLSLLSLGVAACGATQAPKSSTPATNGAPLQHQKSEAHAVDITMPKLAGVDTQLRLTPAASSPIGHGVTLSAVAPASVSSAAGTQVISLPITAGNFVYDKTDHHLTGTIDHSGGFRLIGGNGTTTTIIDLTVNLTTRTVTATVNGTPDVPVFDLSGTANLSVQGVHDVITGLVATTSPKADSAVKAAFGSSANVGDLTVTASAAA